MRDPCSARPLAYRINARDIDVLARSLSAVTPDTLTQIPSLFSPRVTSHELYSEHRSEHSGMRHLGYRRIIDRLRSVYYRESIGQNNRHHHRFSGGTG